MTTDQINSLYRFQTRLAALNKAKLDLEYETMNLRAKGLLPSGDGTPPPAVAVDGAGLIAGDADKPWADYAAAMGGVEAIVAVLEANGLQVENALLKFAR